MTANPGRHRWRRAGGPLLSLLLHAAVVWLLIVRVGPLAQALPDATEVELLDPPVDDMLDPVPEEPGDRPESDPESPTDPTAPPPPPEAPPPSTGAPEPDWQEPQAPDLTASSSTMAGLLALRSPTPGAAGASFGYSGQQRGDLVGTLYDLKRDAKGAPRTPDYVQDVRGILEGRLSAQAFAPFYRATNRTYLTHLFVPVQPAEAGPAAFSAGGEIQPRNWLVHYRGTVRAPRAGRYRFVGMFDDLLVVLVDRRIALEFLWTGDLTPWAPRDHVDEHPCFAGRPLVYGDWIELSPDRPRELDLLVGEHPGGLVGGVLMIEEEGATYERAANGRPILPLFAVQAPDPAARLRLSRFDAWAFPDETPVFSTPPAERKRPTPVRSEEVVIEII